VLFTVLVSLLFPGAITISSFLSRKITAPLITESLRGFTSVQDEFSSDSLRHALFDDDGASAHAGILGATKNFFMSGAKIRNLNDHLKNRMEQMSLWTINLIAGYLFDCIIFPFSLFFVFFTSGQWIALFFSSGRKERH
jgi:hypothetical protein